ncbi:sugar nucleotide-binding protein [Bacillus infantis]|uniref:sugar nucleotide-binding protein n=1 Tax=Bacillus infantis TaxID=324767 RepID=UPI0020039F0D|nr:sugar nucleotide-binding protein [Bacillus infantis]MCK6207890.1 sugar nucleotide-binding protein [Bacillus infantis]
MKKLLILGASGLIGKALAEQVREDFKIYATYHSAVNKTVSERDIQLDVGDPGAAGSLISSIRPDITVSCLRGDFSAQLKFHQELAEAMKDGNSMLYYFSTANVFDGDFSKHHNENDMPQSQTDYGRFKIRCESMLQGVLGERAAIIRIPAIWGKKSQRLSHLKDALQKKEGMEAYTNLACNHLTDVQLARAVSYMMENRLKGIFHLGTKDMLSQFAFAARLAERLPGNQESIRPVIFEDEHNSYHFGLESIRQDIPPHLVFSHDDMIEELLK